MSLKFIRRTLYSLSRRYGAAVDYYRNTSQVVDNATGVTVYTRTKQRVRRAIRLPDTRTRQFAQDIAYLAANKNFTYGATWDQGKREFLIEGRQLAGLVPRVGDWIVHDNKRWNIKEVVELDYHAGYAITTIQIDGDELQKILEAEATATVALTHQAQENHP